MANYINDISEEGITVEVDEALKPFLAANLDRIVTNGATSEK